MKLGLLSFMLFRATIYLLQVNLLDNILMCGLFMKSSCVTLLMKDFC